MMLSYLYQDLLKYSQNGDILSRLKIIVFSHAFHLNCFLRLAQTVRMVKFFGNPLGLIFDYFIRIYFASDISSGAKIGAGLMFVHGHDIVIGAAVSIGNNCKIFNGVTLGNKNTEVAENEQPMVGSGVVLSTGAKILGNITIGDNVIVGANSVVLQNIPSGCIAVGIPAKIKKPVRR